MMTTATREPYCDLVKFVTRGTEPYGFEKEEEEPNGP